MNYKIIISFFVFLVFLWAFFWESAYSESCKYISEIQRCKEANKNWTTKSIEDFVCIVWDGDDIAYQVVLDKEFKKIDNDIDKYLFDLEKYKNLYFWINKSKTYIDGVDDIFLAKKYFHKEYNEVCNEKLVYEVASCHIWDKTTIRNAKRNFSDWIDCRLLINTKLEIFEDVAFNILMMNKAWVRADEKKLYDQVQRTNYDNLLDIMNVNIWYLERIWQKTPTLTRNVHN